MKNFALLTLLLFVTSSQNLFAEIENPYMWKAVVADPANDLPRLVYADWLEENGDPDRAEFIRASIFVYRVEEKGGPQNVQEWKDYIAARGSRERMWSKLRTQFAEKYPRVLVKIWHFARGFAGEINWWEMTRENGAAISLSNGTKSFQMYRLYQDAADISSVEIFSADLPTERLARAKTIILRGALISQFNNTFGDASLLQGSKLENVVLDTFLDSQRGTIFRPLNADAAARIKRFYLNGPGSELFYDGLTGATDVVAGLSPTLTVSELSESAFFPRLDRLTLQVRTSWSALGESEAVFTNALKKATNLKHVGILAGGFDPAPVEKNIAKILGEYESVAVSGTYSGLRSVKADADLSVSGKFYTHHGTRFTTSEPIKYSGLAEAMMSGLEKSTGLCTVVDISGFVQGTPTEFEEHFINPLSQLAKAKPNTDRLSITVRDVDQTETVRKPVDELSTEQNPGLLDECQLMRSGNVLGKHFVKRFSN